MCGRFSLAIAPEKLAELFQTINFQSFQDRFNIAPTQPIMAIRETERGRLMDGFRWGLVPFWAKDIQIGQKLSNARCETLDQKPSFRAAFKYRRCIIPASGFYEWKLVGRRKQPFHIRRKDLKPLAMAGLWEHWTAPDGSELQSATIITTEANQTMAPLHHRMPVVLDSKDYSTWLNPKLQKTTHLKPLLEPCAENLLETFEVSAYVNKAGNEGPACVAPFRGKKRATIQQEIQGELF